MNCKFYERLKKGSARLIFSLVLFSKHFRCCAFQSSSGVFQKALQPKHCDNNKDRNTSPIVNNGNTSIQKFRQKLYYKDQ